MDAPVYIGDDLVKRLKNRPGTKCTYRVSLGVFNKLFQLDWKLLSHRLQKPAPPNTEIFLIQMTKTNDNPLEQRHVLCFGKRVVDDREVSTIAGRAPYDFPIIPVELERVHLDQYKTKDNKIRPSSMLYSLTIPALDGFMEYHFPELRLSSIEKKTELWYRVYKDEGHPYEMRLTFQ